MALTKLGVAKTQLLTAIRLFLHDADPVSVHTLAGAAQDILEWQCRRAQVPPFMDDIHATFPDRPMRSLRDTLYFYRNAFKHGKESDDDALSQFTDELNDDLIFVCISDYLRLVRKAPVEFQVMQGWYICVHANRLGDYAEKTGWWRLFPDIATQPRPIMKERALAFIAKAFSDSELMSDPGTEPPS